MYKRKGQVTVRCQNRVLVTGKDPFNKIVCSVGNTFTVLSPVSPSDAVLITIIKPVLDEVVIGCRFVP